jgi:hypothetical protein
VYGKLEDPKGVIDEEQAIYRTKKAHTMIYKTLHRKLKIEQH